MRWWTALGLGAIAIGLFALGFSLRPSRHETPAAIQMTPMLSAAPQSQGHRGRDDSGSVPAGPPHRALDTLGRPSPPRCAESDVDRAYRKALLRSGAFAETRHGIERQP